MPSPIFMAAVFISQCLPVDVQQTEAKFPFYFGTLVLQTPVIMNHTHHCNNE